MLLHRLEQGGLGFGGSAVNFVREDDVCEDWALGKYERPLPWLIGFLKNVGPGDIARHQVRGELDPAEIQCHDLR